jgi:uracil-DNA glycosylase
LPGIASTGYKDGMIDASALPPTWATALKDVLSSPPLQMLDAFLQAEEAAGKVIYPPRDARLRALQLTPLDQVKVVILGQDPYHGPGQAHGLAFSVPTGVKVPPSLVNIGKELASDLGLPRPSQGNLTHWAQQGVLMLNNALTVEAGHAGSHQGRGWEGLTDAIVAAVAQQDSPSVFMLWGAHAQKKAARVPELVALDDQAAGGEAGRHLILRAPHPSPLSARTGFFGSRPFSQANAFLQAHGRSPIDWLIQP